MQKMIYSVASVDVTNDAPMELDIVGSEETRDAAVKSCASYIMDRLDLRPDIRFALMHDENHPDLAEELAHRTPGDTVEFILDLFSYEINAAWELDEVRAEALKDILVGTIRYEGGYDIETSHRSEIGEQRFLFAVMENPLTTGEEEDDGK